VPPGRTVTTFRIDDDTRAAMDELRDRDGIGYSEQIRRALLMFLESKGVTMKRAERKRVAPRRRS
jgi:predicted transcriptional regulator